MGERRFAISITATHPDAVTLVRQAAEKIACEVGWGDDQHASIEATEVHDGGARTYLAGWELEPGSQSDYDVDAIARGPQ